MRNRMSSLAESWQTLTSRAAEARGYRIVDLLVNEPDRLARLSVEVAGLYVDLSRNPITDADLQALLNHAHAADLTQRRDAMLRGEHVNATEGRPALHTALRASADESLIVDGVDVVAEVQSTLGSMARFCDGVRDGSWCGATGRPIADIVNIGIGGSYLGPQLACEALHEFSQPGLRCHFLASLDPLAWKRLVTDLNPQTTLIVVASKSWRTLETALNAQAVNQWFRQSGIHGEALKQHFVAVSANTKAAVDFGIAAENVFPFWDWVGGRYSMWSAIGLPLMLSIGPANFRRMLDGARQMDRHFAEQPPQRNAPILLALAGVWNAIVLGSRSEAVVPYSDGLRRLPAYLQQLQMESNGKRVSIEGESLPWPTAPVTWGEPGTEAQHSFFQMLHQGTDPVPVEFVLPVASAGDQMGRDISLIANCLAQADALLHGQSLEEARATLGNQGLDAEAIEAMAPHLVYPGNRPTTTILLESLDPERLGALIALYEHKTAALGWLWNINSFDQWGVEVGKQLATRIQPLLQDAGESAAPQAVDPSTAELVRRIRGLLAQR